MAEGITRKTHFPNIASVVSILEFELTFCDFCIKININFLLLFQIFMLSFCNLCIMGVTHSYGTGLIYFTSIKPNLQLHGINSNN